MKRRYEDERRLYITVLRRSLSLSLAARHAILGLSNRRKRRVAVIATVMPCDSPADISWDFSRFEVFPLFFRFAKTPPLYTRGGAQRSSESFTPAYYVPRGTRSERRTARRAGSNLPITGRHFNINLSNRESLSLSLSRARYRLKN